MTSRVLVAGGALAALSMAALLAATALLAVYFGGTVPAAVLAALAAAGTVLACGVAFTAAVPPWTATAQAAASVGLLALLVFPEGRLWGVPYAWWELATLTPLGGAVAAGLYLGAVGFGYARWRLPIWPRAGLFLLLVPFLFNLLLLLGSTPRVEELGWRLSLKSDIGYETWRVIGRFVVLLIVNEVILVGLGYVLDARWIRRPRFHLLLVGASLVAAITPQLADLGSGGLRLDSIGAARVAAIAVAAAAFAALWGQVYLVTGVVLDAFHGRRPATRVAIAHWREGAAKGAIYAAVLMALVHGAVVLATSDGLPAALAAAPTLSGAVGGALLFPLARTIVETFDGSPPFARRLRANASLPWAYARGAVVGGGLAAALAASLPDAAAGTRFLVGLLVGAGAYGGVDLARDLVAILRRVRTRPQDPRVYLLGAMLGGIVGGALAWYFDAAQLATVERKVAAYATIASTPEAYVIYPLFSKWGAFDLGVVTGGVRLLFSESVSGVINWSLAAPLFSVNLVLLTALFERRLDPIRRLVTAEGLAGLVEQAIRVLRWGLWMAPIIYTFLKLAPDPTWYNQDGAIRTAVATAQSWWLGPDAFRAWSLELFLGLLAYDWLRVLIWFDHMGLRVATLVNLSFIGGDRVDERAGRWLGFAATTRPIPEGVRRFATWAPLLIPFYIPRGAEWDQVWTGADQVRAAAGPLLPPVATLVSVYGLLAALVAMVAIAAWLRHGRPLPAFRSPLPAPDVHTLGNGVYALELGADGRGYSRALSLSRRGLELDLTRRPDDPLRLRGKFVYLRETDAQGLPLGPLWSLGRQPCLAVGPDYGLSQPTPTTLRLVNSQDLLRAEAEVELLPEEPVERWRLHLRNAAQRRRFVEITTYQELGLHVPGAYQRTPAYNAMHVATWFVRDLGAVLARNRLIKTADPDPARQRAAPEIAFHAVGATEQGAARLIAYEDNRACFIGSGTLRDPAACAPGGMRDPEDEGLLYSFDPIASLRVLVELPPGGAVEIPFLDGLAADEAEAAALIGRELGRPVPLPARLEAVMLRHRELIEPFRAAPDVPCYRWAGDGSVLHTTPDTTRPWAHVMASPLGHGAIVANDGEMYAFSGNAQQNGLTPFGHDSVSSQLPAQLVYVVDLATGEMDTPTFIPYRRADARHEVEFGRGQARFRKSRGALELELTVFVVPERPAELKLLRIRNHAPEARRFRVVSYAQIALAELPDDTRWTGIDCRADPDAAALYFASHGQPYRRGWAYAAFSLPCEAHATVRAQFVGGDWRDLANPCFVQFGGPDTGRPDDGFRCAALAGSLDVPAGGEVVVAIVLGQADSFAEAQALAQTYRDVAAAEQALAETEAYWARLLGRLRIDSSLPALDRLLNDWLPYQLLTARLWGRAGPSQRGGAYGFRDQLQDVLALLPIRPDLARTQILLHAAQQFVEGDVLKWWHVSWHGETGRGERTRSSDPHLWLPYVVTRYVRATGDRAILDEPAPFIEGDALPPDRDGMLIAVRRSREVASLWEHCRRCVALATRRTGRHGLPLMGTGDWNDGYDAVGRKGRGESGWVGFLLYDVLLGMAELATDRGAEAEAGRHVARARELRVALERSWRDGRYLRATTDDGAELLTDDALMAAWPALSGAVDLDRGLEALEHGLARLERDTMVLLLDPPFDDRSRPYPGRIADYPPGVRENGGQYSHGASWLVDALAALALAAEDDGRRELARRLRARAVEVWLKVSPLDEVEPERIDRYGLPPHQQPADVYAGPAHGGRGGWSWYTGSAARMVAAAHAILGLEMRDGALHVPPDLLEPKGALRVRRLMRDGRVTAEAHAALDARPPESA